MEWFTVAKNLLALVVLITTMIKDSQQRGLGRLEATNEALLKAQQDIAYASAIEEDAERGFKTNPTGNDSDAAFEVPDGQ
jgi:hypothetical protein